MIWSAIQPANSKSARKKKKQPTTPKVLLSCQLRMVSIAECETHGLGLTHAWRRWEGRAGRHRQPGLSFGEDAHQCKVSLEPSAAAVIIAGIPIARVATAIARASIMAIPLDSVSSSGLIGSLRNRFADQTSTARLLQAYFTAKVLVSRLVATIGFRNLWRKSDTAHGSHPTMLRGDVTVRRRAGPTSGSVGLPTPLHLFRCSDSPTQHRQRERERARQ
jgi:hypothetical protein